MEIRKHIPNAITCMSLVSGCIAIVMALQGNLLWALIWIIIAAIFDFTDGFAARMLKAASPIGKDLDSLSDMVSFGVAPGMMIYEFLLVAIRPFPENILLSLIPYLAFIIPAFSGLRLAKFNNDSRQTDTFIGLPVPAHALLWASAACTLTPLLPSYASVVIPALLAGVTVTSFLLVSEVPMFSLKAKSLAWKGNELRYILVLSGVLLIVIFGIPGISGAIILYILLSIFNRKS